MERITDRELVERINTTESLEELDELIAMVNRGAIVVVDPVSPRPIPTLFKAPVPLEPRRDKPSRRQRQRKLLTRKPR